MQRGNVLVIGNSGVGKSTLINAVLGEKKAITNYGTTGITKKLEIYESEKLPFRVIDTIGFEPSFIKEQQAINAVKKWSRQCAKKGQADNQINVIWFCVDGCARKLFPKSIQSFLRATSMWKSVPVIVVITKSYAVPERQENIALVEKAFSIKPEYNKNLKAIIPVVASTYVLDETAFAPPYGIDDLIDITNELMPEGLHAAAQDLSQFKLSQKRYLAHSVVVTSAASAATIGAVSLPFADAMLLTPLELAEINAIASIYKIKRNEKSKQFIDYIVEVGTVSAAAKAAISALKLIPGIHIGAGILNAVIASSIAAALGEGAIYAFEQVHLGNKTLDDLDWLKKVLESKLSTEFFNKVSIALQNSKDNLNTSAIVDLIISLLKTK